MITLFTTAKPFLGHSGIIQRNALQSWKRLHSDVEIILFGDEEGVAEVCAEFGLRHEPHVERDPSGLKFIHSIFDRAKEIASYEVIGYVNCDIILSSDFLDAVQRIHAAHSEFLMVGRRWDADIVQPIDFSRSLWSDAIRQLARKANSQRDGWWIDYFCFSRNLFYRHIPALVIGRVFWDNWLIWKAIDSGVAVVDASSVVIAVHQNHGYSYHPNGRQGVWTDERSQRNLTFAGGWRHLRAIGDATTRLTADKIKQNRARHWLSAKRLWKSAREVLIYNVWLPVWHFCLGITRPVRALLGLRSKFSSQQTKKDLPRARTLP
jgi:hypothetical protein